MDSKNEINFCGNNHILKIMSDLLMMPKISIVENLKCCIYKKTHPR